jgi:hypothetical protein
MPNTNVTVEYGYAIKAVGYARIVSLMNTAYGKPRSDDGREFLPFDMRHLREPIAYCLEEKPDAGELRTVKEQLVRDLKLAIRDVIRDKLASMEWSFHEFLPPEKPSWFLRSDEKLTQEMDDLKNRSIDIHLRDSSNVFLRVQPRAIFAPRPHNEVRQIACASIPPFLKPSMASGSCNWGRNRYGFVFHNGPIRGSEATKVVQIFTTGEIWAINASFLDQDGPILPFETMFETALTAYRDFLVREFGVDPPFRFIAGMTGLEGRNLVLARIIHEGW